MGVKEDPRVRVLMTALHSSLGASLEKEEAEGLLGLLDKAALPPAPRKFQKGDTIKALPQGTTYTFKRDLPIAPITMYQVKGNPFRRTGIEWQDWAMAAFAVIAPLSMGFGLAFIIYHQ